VGGLEVDLFLLMAQEFNEKAVEEFAKYFIGRPTTLPTWSSARCW
jgi:hypothetical protein